MRGWIAAVVLRAAAGCRGPEQYSAPAPGGAPDPDGPAGDARQLLVKCMTARTP